MSALKWALSGASLVQFAQDMAAAIKAATTEVDWLDHPLRQAALARYGDTLLALLQRTPPSPQFWDLCDRMERVLRELPPEPGEGGVA